MKYLISLLQHTNFNLGFKILVRQSHSGLLSEEISKNFHKSLPKIIHDVLHAKKYKNLSGFEDKIQKTTDYRRKENKIGGATLLHAYTMLEKTENDGLRQQAFVLAWAVDMIHSCLSLMDDGALKNPEDSAAGAKDADLLRSFVHVMLEEHFGGSTQYNDILKLYNQAFIYSAFAREIEHKNSNSITNFNKHLYHQICEYKSYPSLTLPLMLALRLANRGDNKTCIAVENITSEMGKLHQMKKDYHNCFGSERTLGTEGTDIQKNRCTWLSTAALQRFTPRQRVVFSACYGDNQPAHVERIKVLYQDLRLSEVFRQEIAAMCDSIREKAKGLERQGVPSGVFLRILDEILRENDGKYFTVRQKNGDKL